jgi:hypothetical protein
MDGREKIAPFAAGTGAKKKILPISLEASNHPEFGSQNIPAM